MYLDMSYMIKMPEKRREGYFVLAAVRKRMSCPTKLSIKYIKLLN